MLPNFLIDENVRRDLLIFLTKKDFKVLSPQKGTTDNEIAKLCLNKKLILVTNDTDFSKYSKSKIYSVILLKIPQAAKDALLNLFEKLLSKQINFEGKLIILYLDGETIENL